MDRSSWLKEMRRECEEQYDTRWATFYGEASGLYNNATHQRFIQEFLSRLPAHSTLLDAACGAGRYLPFLLEKGHSVIGIDQSHGMLANAKAKFPGVRFEQIGLQEMAFQGEFDGATCMDALENVPPEDWPLVLGAFHRALKPQGYLYFTTETLENADEQEVRQAFEKAQAGGLPVVFGECPEEDGVYHYHPSNAQVLAWTRQAGFEVVQEENGEVWYYHVLARKG